MVDIVQSNKKSILVRKIGYSVGLESTYQRVGLLVDLYVESQQLTEVAWKRLLEKSFGRKDSNAVHFENFFGALNIMTVSSGRPIPLTILDVLGLLRRFYGGSLEKYRSACQAVLVYAFTASDGELLAALLEAEFDERKYVDKLSAFRRLKLSVFYDRYKAVSQREVLYRVINFEEFKLAQTTDKTRRRSWRAPPFVSTSKSKKKEVNLEDFTVKLSEDWFTKVPGRRREWCVDLGLLEKRRLTSFGERYLDSLRKWLPDSSRSEHDNYSSVVIMPTDLEMLNFRLSWLLDNELRVGLSRMVHDLSVAYFQLPAEDIKELSAKEVVKEILPFCFEVYVKADIRFSMLRRELPYPILLLFCLGYAAAEGRSVGDLEQLLSRNDRNNVDYYLRSSRNSLFGIKVHRGARQGSQT